jgi:hypothetical protein
MIRLDKGVKESVAASGLGLGIWELYGLISWNGPWLAAYILNNEFDQYKFSFSC